MVNVGSDTSDVVASEILTNISIRPVSLGEPGCPELGIYMSPVSLGERAWANPVGLSIPPLIASPCCAPCLAISPHTSPSRRAAHPSKFEMPQLCSVADALMLFCC